MAYRMVMINGEYKMAYVPEPINLNGAEVASWLLLFATIAGVVGIDHFLGNHAAMYFIAAILAVLGFFFVRAVLRTAFKMFRGVARLIFH